MLSIFVAERGEVKNHSYTFDQLRLFPYGASLVASYKLIAYAKNLTNNNEYVHEYISARHQMKNDTIVDDLLNTSIHHLDIRANTPQPRNSRV